MSADVRAQAEAAAAVERAATECREAATAQRAAEREAAEAAAAAAAARELAAQQEAAEAAVAGARASLGAAARRSEKKAAKVALEEAEAELASAPASQRLDIPAARAVAGQKRLPLRRCARPSLASASVFCPPRRAINSRSAADAQARLEAAANRGARKVARAELAAAEAELPAAQSAAVSASLLAAAQEQQEGESSAH